MSMGYTPYDYNWKHWADHLLHKRLFMAEEAGNDGKYGMALCSLVFCFGLAEHWVGVGSTDCDAFLFGAFELLQLYPRHAPLK